MQRVPDGENDGDYLAIVMQFIPGGTLQDFLEHRGYVMRGATALGTRRVLAAFRPISSTHSEALGFCGCVSCVAREEKTKEVNAVAVVWPEALTSRMSL